MEVDMSDYTIEGVLSIECEDGWWRPVAFLLKSLNKIERNWDSWQRNIGSYKRARKLEISIRECKIQVWGLDRP